MKTLFKTLLALCASVSVLSCNNNGIAASGKAGGEDFRTAIEIRNAVTVGWNLGNALSAYNGTDEAEGQGTLETQLDWHQPYSTKSMIDAAKKAGFNAVRVPVRWYPHFKMVNGKLEMDQKWMDRVQEVVDWCIENDMITLLNLHDELWLESHPFYADSSRVLDKERQLWTVIANHFKDYDDRLIFQGTNEVHIMGDWGPVSEEKGQMQNVFNQTFVDAVRATGGNNYNRNLMVQLYYCDPVTHVGHFRVPKDVVDNHLLLEIHLYRPSTYVHIGAEKYWGAEYFEDIFKEPVVDPSELGPMAGFMFAGVTKERIEMYLANKKAHPEITDEMQLEKTYADIAASLKPFGLPVFLTESGASRWIEVDAPASERNDRMKASRAYFYEYYIKTARKNGIAPFVWDNGEFGVGVETFGLFDRKNNMYPDQVTIDGIMRGAKEPYGE